MSEEKNTIKSPCVYFVTDGEFVKIGATNDFQNRLRILQTANSRTLKVLNIIKTNKPYELESKLHKKMNTKRYAKNGLIF